MQKIMVPKSKSHLSLKCPLAFEIHDKYLNIDYGEILTSKVHAKELFWASLCSRYSSSRNKCRAKILFVGLCLNDFGNKAYNRTAKF